MTKRLIVILFAAMFVFGCGSTTKVSRVSTDTTTDLSGKWNDTDSRLVAEKIVDDVLSNNWLFNFIQTHNQKPVVIVGNIANKTSEHIDTEIFCKDIERELINAGRVRFVAGAQQRREVREERLDQQTHASMETAKKLANELGADFMLKGSLKSIEDSVEGQKVVYYQADLELINLETNEISWMGSKKIKKKIERSGYKW
ncbi:MAG: penicillin-binding protein activator LpoB [Candidatus Cloacimonetes bacterium]|nr:penicillin-binding protein activator LpoB [Candidatus Cloacimonadota bacterium]MBS3767505.1 penicillin-binding protein activator LpoB [Candidatus Cloacimonadota bacterium]